MVAAVLESAEIRARVKSCSVEDYHRQFELGMIGRNFELIRGAIIEKMPQSPLHALLITLVRERLADVLPPNTFVREEKPLTLTDSEPEPDLAVIRGRSRDFSAAHPTSAILVIEVSIGSESLDRIKLDLYAEAGVPECWLILPATLSVECYTEPATGNTLALNASSRLAVWRAWSSPAFGCRRPTSFPHSLLAD